jgi:hypothetical protein
MKRLVRLYYKLFPHYTVLETKWFKYSTADMLIKETADKSEAERWVLAKEEDKNRVMGIVCLCRKVRIIE